MAPDGDAVRPDQDGYIWIVGRIAGMFSAALVAAYPAVPTGVINVVLLLTFDNVTAADLAHQRDHRLHGQQRP